MKKWLVLFLAVSFILWILPLGVFIKPSQEKIVCDGLRAMCMCTMGHRSADKVMEPGISLKAASQSKENSSGGGNYFVSAKPVVIFNLRLASIVGNQFFLYKNPFLATLEYVPKV